MIRTLRAKKREKIKVGDTAKALAENKVTINVIGHGADKQETPTTVFKYNDSGSDSAQLPMYITDNQFLQSPTHFSGAEQQNVFTSTRLVTILNPTAHDEALAFNGTCPRFMSGCQSLAAFNADWLERDATCIILLLFVTWSSWSRCNVSLNASDVLWRHLIATLIGMVCSGIGLFVDARYFDCDLVAGGKAFAALNRDWPAHLCIGLIVAYLTTPFLAAEMGFYEVNACFTPGRRPAS